MLVLSTIKIVPAKTPCGECIYEFEFDFFYWSFLFRFIMRCIINFQLECRFCGFLCFPYFAIIFVILFLNPICYIADRSGYSCTSPWGCSTWFFFGSKSFSFVLIISQ